MSTETMLVHVPVDEIEIVRGSLSAFDLFFFLGLPKLDKSIELTAILRTAASTRTFKRTIIITEVLNIKPGRRSGDLVTFIGTYAGQSVKGVYEGKTRKGSFRLAD